MYTAYNLYIDSEVSLPELVDCPGEDKKPDILVREADVKGVGAGKGSQKKGIWAEGDGVYFHWDSAGTFFLRGDNEIIIDRKPGVTDEAIRLPLLGCVLGVLLHRKGFFTLHASAVVIDGHAIGFIGDKGAGKSTLAAAMHGRGHSVMVDDVLALNMGEDGSIVALPGFPQYKLWPASVVALGREPSELAQLHPELEKRALRLREGVQETALPLKQIYVLEEADEPHIERLSSKEAYMNVFRHQYAPRFLGQTGEDIRLFRQCQALAQQIPVYRLSRPKEFSRLPEVLSLLENNVMV